MDETGEATERYTQQYARQGEKRYRASQDAISSKLDDLNELQGLTNDAKVKIAQEKTTQERERTMQLQAKVRTFFATKVSLQYINFFVMQAKKEAELAQSSLLTEKLMDLLSKFIPLPPPPQA